MTLLERLRKVEPDGEGERTRWYRNPDGPEAADEIERLREALGKYDCLHKCTEPCALYHLEKSKEETMPHMICGWWASAALRASE